MEKLMDKIFDKVVCVEPDYKIFGKSFDKQLDLLLEPYKQDLSVQNEDKLRALIYSAAYYAQKDGFNMGVRASMKLMMEALGEVR